MHSKVIRPRGSNRGVFLCAGIILVGMLLVSGLYLVRGPVSPPAQVQWGVPERKLRFVSYNIKHNERGMARVVDEIRKLEPDFVFLQEVEHKDALAMADNLDMRAAYHPNAYQRRSGSWGNLILTKHPLYEAGPIKPGATFGAWGISVVDGKKFGIASVHLSATWNANPAHIKQSGEYRWMELTDLHNAWKQRGSPPMIVGGDFNQIPFGNNYELMTRDWSDALLKLGRNDMTFASGLVRTRIDYFLTSRDWNVVSGDVVNSDASDHRLIWVEVGN